MKIALLGASFDTHNLGVGALTAGTIKAALHQYPHAEIFLLDYGKESTTYHFEANGDTIPIRLVNMRFSKKIYLRNNIAVLILISLLLRLIPSEKMKDELIKRNSCLSNVLEADIVAAISGGDSFSDIYGLGRLLYVALPQVLVLLLGKNLILLPQTLGPFRSPIAKKIAKFIMGKAKIVYSRDYDGIGETRKMLSFHEKSEKIRFCYDVGFVLDPVRPVNMDLQLDNLKNEGKPVVGLNISGLLYMGGYTGNNMFGLKIDYKAFILNLIDFMIKKKNATVMLIPHVFGTQGESDSAVCEKIYLSLRDHYEGLLVMASGAYNQNEIKHIIGLCDFFIGSRMHACIAALSQNVPAVSISYSKKFVGVMQTIGVEELVADPRKLGKDEILGIIDKAFEQKDLLRENLREKIPQVKETVLNLFKEIGSGMEV